MISIHAARNQRRKSPLTQELVLKLSSHRNDQVRPLAHTRSKPKPHPLPLQATA